MFVADNHYALRYALLARSAAALPTKPRAASLYFRHHLSTYRLGFATAESDPGSHAPHGAAWNT
jgi:hypothetical protein